MDWHARRNRPAPQRHPFRRRAARPAHRSVLGGRGSCGRAKTRRRAAVLARRVAWAAT